MKKLNKKDRENGYARAGEGDRAVLCWSGKGKGRHEKARLVYEKEKKKGVKNEVLRKKKGKRKEKEDGAVLFSGASGKTKCSNILYFV